MSKQQSHLKDTARLPVVHGGWVTHQCGPRASQQSCPKQSCPAPTIISWSPAPTSMSRSPADLCSNLKACPATHLHSLLPSRAVASRALRHVGTAQHRACSPAGCISVSGPRILPDDAVMLEVSLHALERSAGSRQQPSQSSAPGSLPASSGLPGSCRLSASHCRPPGSHTCRAHHGTGGGSSSTLLPFRL